MECYTRCARTNNHTVREAACTCIAELASKIDPDAVRPHLPAMLRTLITCLRDDSWPVRHRPQLNFEKNNITSPNTSSYCGMLQRAGVLNRCIAPLSAFDQRLRKVQSVAQSIWRRAAYPLGIFKLIMQDMLVGSTETVGAAPLPMSTFKMLIWAAVCIAQI